jgi:diguanylate cyclase (GGDEF)-like protein
MAVDSLGARRTRSAALAVLPILLLSIFVIASISLLSRSAYDANEHEARLLEQRRIENAIEHEARNFAETVQREVALMSNDAPERRVDMEKVSKYLFSEHLVDFVAVYLRDGKRIAVSASRQELVDRRLKAADELIALRKELRTPYAIKRIGTSATLLEPTAYIAMSAINVNDAFEVVVTRRIEAPVMARIGRELMLNNLRFRDDVTRDIKDAEDPTLTLVWDHMPSGAITLDSIANIGHLGMIVVAIYGLLVFLHIRRVTRELAHSEAAAQHLAGHDALSGLPNRSLFSKTLNQKLDLLSAGNGLAVMYLDLDRFKEVNDQHGHAAGDRLIGMVADRLTKLLRGSDTVARFGGDEFAIIQVGVKAQTDCEALAGRILEVLHQPFDLGDATVHIGCSVGISVAPENTSDSATLMRYADVALYRAKKEGRNRFSFFEQEMNESLRRRQMIEDELRSAIETDQLVLHYQPIVTADGEKTVGVEALVRWLHPTRGIIAPDEFISVAEERGLITALGDWVLRRACLDSRLWPDLTVAVNVSPVQFRHRGFVTTVARILAETGMDPSRLELELTEGVVVDDAEKAEAAMKELRAMGVRLALDDFGVGYSSLIYLRRFAFDKIKIDRSFLESMEATGESAILVHSIVHLGRALGLIVTAEGVELESQRRFLQAVGCHQLQGYLFSKPCPADQLCGQLQQPANREAAA